MTAKQMQSMPNKTGQVAPINEVPSPVRMTGFSDVLPKGIRKSSNHQNQNQNNQNQNNQNNQNQNIQNINHSNSNSSTRHLNSMQRKQSLKEGVGISFHTLAFSDAELEKRFLAARQKKFYTRLRFGAAFTAFFIPLLVIMQIKFKSNDDEVWASVPHVLLFPGIVFVSGLSVYLFIGFFQRHSFWLTFVCIVAQISALLDTTTAGTSVSERNVWVQFIFALGIISSTGITFIQSMLTLGMSSSFFVALAWARFVLDSNDASLPTCERNAVDVSIPGTSMSAVLLYALLLAFLAWNWELEERRDFILTERLAKENVSIQMTMEMTGWFSGGASEEMGEHGTAVLGANAHIDVNEIQLIEELGVGSFASVYSAMYKETKVAVKKLFLGGEKEKLMKGFGAEVTLMASLRHPNVVMFMGVMVHAEFVGLVMELCPKGSLFNILRRETISVDWSLLLRMLLDGARGMNFLHSNSRPIVHRDLKSLNLLIDADWRCKVSDFGLSKLKTLTSANETTDFATVDAEEASHAPRKAENNYDGGKGPANLPSSNVAPVGQVGQVGDGDGDGDNNRRVFVGSTMWLAPEIFTGEEHTDSSDIYSFGIILYEVLSRQMPYASIASESIPFVVQTGKRPTDFAELPEFENVELLFLAELMKECWSSLPENRPRFSAIILKLQLILTNYIGKEPWEDYVVFPDRKINVEGGGDDDTSSSTTKAGFLINEEDVSIGETIGKGAFGAVYKGTYYGTPVAIKKLFITGVSKDVLKEFNKECEIMQNLRHPNIVLFMGSCCNPPTLLLVTELLKKGSLFDIYHNFPAPHYVEHLQLAISIAVDMARGLAYLHNHDPVVIHRDLKSQNILLDDKMRAKIADFGLSKFRDSGKTMSICGSPLWVAPEVLRGEKYGLSCDVYSFAVIVWEVLAWSEPYPDMSSKDVMNGVALGTLRPTPPPFTPKALAQILKDCYNTKPANRPTFDDIVPLLEEIQSEVVKSPTTTSK